MLAGRVGRGAAFSVLFFLVLGVATLARFHEIGSRPIWFDEGVTLGVVRLPLGEFLRNAWDVKLNNQVFYYLALRPWHVLGESEATVRAFSAVFSAFSVALIVLLGRRLFGTAAGLSAGALLSVHWFSIRYAQEARSYAFTTFLACLAALLLARFLERGRRRDLAGWTLISGLTVYAHFFALFPIAAQALSLLALGPRALNQRRTLAAGLAGIALLATPIVVFLAGAPPSLLRWLPPVSADRMIQQTGYLAGGGGELPWIYALVFALLLVRIVTESNAIARWGIALALSWAIVPLLAMSAVSLWNPILLNRYLAMSVPAWPLAAAAIVRPLPAHRWLTVAGYALLGVVLVSEIRSIGSAYRAGTEDWRAPAAMVARDSKPGDVIIYNSPWSAFAFGYYLERAPRRPEPLQQGNLLYTEDFDVAQAAGHERIWVVLSRHDRKRAAAMHAALVRTHPKTWHHNFGALRVVLYERDPKRQAAAQPGP